MSTFTPHFLEEIGGSPALAAIVDISLLESKFNGGSVTKNLYECIRDKGYSIQDARQNSEYLSSWIERGVFWTTLSRHEYGLKAKTS